MGIRTMNHNGDTARQANGPTVDLIAKVSGDARFDHKEKSLILRGLEDRLHPPVGLDRVVYRMVVVFLGLVVTLTVIGGFRLANKSQELPAGLIALGSASIGALAGLLAPAPANLPRRA
jgi:hypothetical protein